MYKRLKKAGIIFLAVVLTSVAGLTAMGADVPQTSGQMQGRVREYPVKHLGNITGKKAQKGVVTFLLGEEKSLNLNRPYGVAIDPSNGDVYITDTMLHQVVVFDQKGNLLRAFGEKSLITPISIAIAADRIYVSDSTARRICAFSKQGKFLFEFGQMVGDPQVLQRPTGLDINRDKGRIYVADSQLHALLVYDLQGKYVKQIGKRGEGNGEFNFPVDVKVGPGGRLHVADTLNYRVQVLDADGEYILQFGKIGDGFGDLPRPKGIAVDKEGRIYVSDGYLYLIQVFDREGKVQFFFGQPGTENTRFVLPAGVAVAPDGRIYVVDSGNKRVQVLAL